MSHLVTRELLDKRKRELRPEVKYDLFKESYVRFLGYTNELGEAARPVLSRTVVNATYGVAIAYALADTGHKAKLAFEHGAEKNLTPFQCARLAIDSGGYTLIWQTLASVLIPPFFINRVVKGSRYLLSKRTSMSPGARRWVSMGCGLSIIPFIFQPIDHGVHWFMENTYAPFSARYILFDHVQEYRGAEYEEYKQQVEVQADEHVVTESVIRDEE